VTEESWPTPQAPSREPLPRVDDLPVAEQGYEQDAVRAAFDSFYRHAAQLDAALRTLEAVDSFHRQAAALRADLRALRAAGWTQQSWNVTPAYGYGARAPREGVSPAVWRIAGEAAFLIAAAVVLGVAKLDWWLIVLVMAGAWTLVFLIEWAAARERYVAPRAAAPPPPVVEAEAVGEQTEEEESIGWMAFEEAQEPSDAMTMVGAPPVAEPEVEPAEAEPEAEKEPAVAEVEDVGEAPEPEAEAEPQPEAEREVEAEPVAETAPEPAVEAEPGTPRRRWWRRRRPADEAPVEAPPQLEQPERLDVLPAEEPQADADRPDPWEQGFDEPTDEDVAPAEELDEAAGAGEPAVAGDADEPARRRFRRR
jgi:hypothetical protein